MIDPVKPRRQYESEQRSEQAAATRAAVIAAAHLQFIENGWSATSVAKIAKAAKVSPETIYAVFGTKAALFAEVVRASVRRDRPDVPLMEQDGPKAVAVAKDQASVLRLFAADISGLLANVAPLMALARGAADSEPAIAATYRRIHEGRRDNLAQVVAALMRNGSLKAGLGEADAIAIVWRLASPEMYLLVTDVEGLDPKRYARWLEQTLTALLLP